MSVHVPRLYLDYQGFVSLSFLSFRSYYGLCVTVVYSHNKTTIIVPVVLQLSFLCLEVGNSIHVLRERLFNLKGGVMFFFLKKYSDSQCCWKKYSDFGEGKKKSDSEFLSYNLMLNSGKKIRALRDKNKNILTLVLSEKKILKETNNHNHPPTPAS